MQITISKISVMLAVLIAGIALPCAYKHFVTNQIMDGGDGMENPDVVLELDGDYTYIDNSLLWPVLKGAWEDSKGRWQAVITEEGCLTLALDGEPLLSSAFHFTYLQPGEVLQTELYLDSYTLRAPNGTIQGEIFYLCHKTASSCSGTLQMEVELSDGMKETVELQKAT